MTLPQGFDREEFIAGLREKHARILPPTVEFAVENGWLQLVADRLRDAETILEKHGWIDRAVIKQIKEKFGELRVYIRPRVEDESYPDELAAELDGLRRVVSDNSAVTCEICSDEGEIGNFGGYYQALCPKHAEQRRQWIARGRTGDLFHD
ncbi:hypothetical protein [Neorhizobium galegae]|uniref:Uncharacterized protein n=1 Tax=Neorhizobium galegae bv. orientalis str. HAMBI 540 TaxID=1028800 RepID=A0A068SM42_NEOGA|nr:hypothetical protein [Neorhizobium galegae]MCQ1855886.1 hypothetical protein [Neorhizobium galegae]CDN46864.1 Hypothetical protein RG540_CH06740 [Neorhizobium galegae bv. orientalis str. HAMBI 540]